MKIMKKPISLILCVVMLILLCAPVYAATPNIDKNLLAYLESAEDDALIPLDITLESRDIRAAVEAAREEKFPEGITDQNADDYIMFGRELAKELYTKMNTGFQEQYFNDECVIHYSSHYTGTIWADVPKALVPDIMASKQLSSIYLLTIDPNEEVFPTEGKDPFEFDAVDVKEDDWFFEAVEFVYAAELMNGIDSYCFAPQDEVSRAMIATVLHRLAGAQKAGGSNPFPDVEAGRWYSDAVIWAAGEKIIEGYGNGSFGTNDPVTREQLVTMLWRYQGKPAGEEDALAAFTDADQISSWAKDAFVWE